MMLEWPGSNQFSDYLSGDRSAEYNASSVPLQRGLSKSGLVIWCLEIEGTMHNHFEIGNRLSSHAITDTQPITADFDLCDMFHSSMIILDVDFE
jgi:hypothetical protein